MDLKVIMKNNQQKVGYHISCGYLMPVIWTNDNIEKNHDIYRGEDCMKKFSESLREHKMKIINFEKKKMIPLTNEHQ